MPLQTILAKRLMLLLTALGLIAAPGGGIAQTPLTLDEDGLGGITASTPFDIPVLHKIVPGVVFERADQQTEDGTRTVIRATRRGRTGFALYSDGRGRVATIEVVSRRVGNRLGPRVSDTYQLTRINDQIGSCWPGTEALSGTVVCEAAQTGRISYVFSGRWNGPDGRLPPTAVLDHWTISQMIWRSDRFEGIAKPPALPSTGPAFDCAKASGSIENMICEGTELARLDQRLNETYAERIATAAHAERRLLRAEQRGWIKGRNDCWKSSDPYRCVVDTYNDRIAELNTETASLPGTSWRGIRIAGDIIPSNIDIDLTFGRDGKITGSSGCNRFFASYDLDGHDVTVNGIGLAPRMCPEIEMLAESRFLDALGKLNGWAMRSDELILFGSGAELAFRQR